MKKSTDKTWIEIYNRSGKFNFRLMNKSNLSLNIILSNRQGYENKKECRRIASKYLPNIEIVELDFYYRVK